MCRAHGTRYVAVLLLVLLTWAGVARGDCTKDTDCKGDRLCQAGKCVAASAAAPAAAPPAAHVCTKDTDCKGDRVCNQGTCTSPGSVPPSPAPAASPVVTAPPAAPAAPVVPAPPATQEPQPHAEDEPWRTGRRGFHVGLGAGGVYVPVGGKSTTGAVVGSFHLNIGFGIGEFRMSPSFLVTESGYSEGLAFVTGIEVRFYIGSVYALGGSPLGVLGYAHFNKKSSGGNDGDTAMVGPSVTPLVLRFGPRREAEVSTTLFIVDLPGFGQVYPGGYLMGSYLFL